jgi:hypothetical protein
LNVPRGNNLEVLITRENAHEYKVHKWSAEASDLAIPSAMRRIPTAKSWLGFAADHNRSVPAIATARVQVAVIN